MADEEGALTLHRVTASEILPYIRTAARHATHYDADYAATMTGTERCYIVKRNGVAIAGYVLNRIGNDLWVEAAAGRAGIDLCALLAELVELQGEGLEYVMFKTTRAGLVKKAHRLGYETAATIMRKRIKK